MRLAGQAHIPRGSRRAAARPALREGYTFSVWQASDPECPMSARRPNSRAQCDKSAERQVYPGVRSCAGAATPRLKLSSPSFCGSSTLGIRLPWRPPCPFFGALPRTRRSRIHPQIHPAGLGSAPRLWDPLPGTTAIPLPGASRASRSSGQRPQISVPKAGAAVRVKSRARGRLEEV